ncbi:MAG: cation transporter [Caldilineaceae bacterium]
MDTDSGIRTVWLALAALTITSILQVVIFWISGSVALLADTIHNIGDGLNSVPLLIAFYLARSRRRDATPTVLPCAEDVAGIFIVLLAFSAASSFRSRSRSS